MFKKTKVTDSGTPLIQKLTEKKIGTEEEQAGIKPTNSELDPEMGFLDKVLFSITGAPTSSLTPQDKQDRMSKRNHASSMAQSAATNPGSAFMGIPTAGGGNAGIGDLLGAVIKTFGLGKDMDLGDSTGKTAAAKQPTSGNKPNEESKPAAAPVPFQIDMTPEDGVVKQEIDPNDVIGAVVKILGSK